MFVIRIEDLEDCLHGELLGIVADALTNRDKKYSKISVSFEEEQNDRVI